MYLHIILENTTLILLLTNSPPPPPPPLQGRDRKVNILSLFVSILVQVCEVLHLPSI